MSASEVNDFGFKRLSMENWLHMDPAWVGVVTSYSRSDPSEAWVNDVSQATLRPEVPLSIRKLFEAARALWHTASCFIPCSSLE